METSLHRQLKEHYAAESQQTEVSLHGFRIDAIGRKGELIEIQHASLGSIRSKIQRLLDSQCQPVRVVKPIIAEKTLLTLDGKDGEVIRKRRSPKRGELLDLFLDLVYFGSVFPHRRLTLEVVLIEAEETRVDRVRKSRRGKTYRMLDQQIVSIQSQYELRTLTDLLELLPISHLPQPFDTAELAAAMNRPRWFAQKVAYCLRNTEAARAVGKRGNSQLYQTRRVRKTKSKIA